MVAAWPAETIPVRICLHHPTRAPSISEAAARFVCYLIVAAALTPTTHGAAPTIPQKVIVKDRQGLFVLTISKITLFRRSDPVFQGVVENVSGHTLSGPLTLNGTVRKKDGSVVQFALGLPDACEVPHMEQKVTYQFPKPWTFSAADVVSVDFSFPSSWQSPEDEMIAAEAQGKAIRDGYRAIAEAFARQCALIYENTANKKTSDLTVKEEQDVKSCQEKRMYPPH